MRRPPSDYSTAFAAALYASTGESKLPLLLEIFGPKVVLQLIAAIGGETVKIPEWAEIAKSLALASAAVEVVDKGSPVAATAARHEVDLDSLIVVVRAMIDGKMRIKKLAELSDRGDIHGIFKG